MFGFVKIGREQVAQRIVDALGLEDAVAVNGAGKADGAVDGRNDGIVVIVDRTCVVGEFANEEIVERREVAGTSSFTSSRSTSNALANCVIRKSLMPVWRIRAIRQITAVSQ